MQKTKLIRTRGGERPTGFTFRSQTFRFVDLAVKGKTRVVGPTGLRGLLEFGPSTP